MHVSVSMKSLQKPVEGDLSKGIPVVFVDWSLFVRGEWRVPITEAALFVGPLLIEELLRPLAGRRACAAADFPPLQLPVITSMKLSWLLKAW